MVACAEIRILAYSETSLLLLFFFYICKIICKPLVAQLQCFSYLLVYDSIDVCRQIINNLQEISKERAAHCL